jgi:hypothetical protein
MIPLLPKGPTILVKRLIRISGVVYWTLVVYDQKSKTSGECGVARDEWQKSKRVQER